MSRPGAPIIGCRHRTAGVHEQRGDGFGVLTPSTPFAYSQAFSRRFAYFRGVSLSVSAGQHDFWRGSIPGSSTGGADELQSAASRWCRSLNGAVARVERAVRHSPGLRCFLNVRVAPWAGLAGTTAQPNVNARSGGGARCVPPANPSVARRRSAGPVGDLAWSPAPQAACCERCPAPKRCDNYLTAPQQHFVRAIPLAFPGMG